MCALSIIEKSRFDFDFTKFDGGFLQMVLKMTAEVEKMMPKSFITKDGFGITKKCRDYLGPLMKGEDYPPYKNGLPDYAVLKNIAVKKKLKSNFDL